jgi:putative transposase
VSGLVSREQIAAKLSGWEGHDMRTKRAGLVQRAEDWRSGSFNRWLHEPERDPRRLTPWPMTRPRRWAERVNKRLTTAELHAVRTSVNRGTPLGDETWVQRIARQLNLQSTLRPRGRPKNES